MHIKGPSQRDAHDVLDRNLQNIEKVKNNLVFHPVTKVIRTLKSSIDTAKIDFQISASKVEEDFGLLEDEA